LIFNEVIKMREILFRGKRMDNGEWTYGLITTLFRDKEYHIVDLSNESVVYPIEPATIGEYTGLTDKNGQKIFEGDILEHSSGTIHEVVFEQRNGKAYFGWVINELETWDFDSGFLKQLKVIGNIHDNPELLGEEALGNEVD